MNHDLVAAISDKATDQLEVLFTTEVGKRYLLGKGVPQDVVDQLVDFGLSSICNMLSAISAAKVLDLGADDVIITVATDGSQMYPSEIAKITERDFGGDFTQLHAAEVWGEHLANVPTDATLELTEKDRNRIFNLGYYTWVEQQGTPFELFQQRRSQQFWRELRPFVQRWDAMITDFNARIAAGSQS